MFTTLSSSTTSLSIKVRWCIYNVQLLICLLLQAPDCCFFKTLENNDVRSCVYPKRLILAYLFVQQLRRSWYGTTSLNDQLPVHQPTSTSISNTCQNRPKSYYRLYGSGNFFHLFLLSINHLFWISHNHKPIRTDWMDRQGSMRK